MKGKWKYRENATKSQWWDEERETKQTKTNELST